MCSAVGDIGLFKILSETGIASGVRRIEAVTGEGALDWWRRTKAGSCASRAWSRAAATMWTTRWSSWWSAKRLEKELGELKAKLASSAGADLASQAVDIGGVKVLAAKLEGADPKGLRDTLDQLKNKLGSAVVVLATETDGKVSLVAGVTKDLTGRIKAGDLVKAAAEKVGGKGGGRPDMAQAGGNDPAGFRLHSGWSRTGCGRGSRDQGTETGLR